MPTPITSNRGFTLIEAVMVLVITAIVAAMVAVFIQKPVQSYVDSARRADLTDIADTAVRRMAREIRLALPNSVRNPADGSDQCIEFMPTKIGARYRAEQGVAADNILDFTTADPSFDMLGPNTALPADEQIAAGDVVVVYNDGTANGNAYMGTNAIQIAAGGVVQPGGSANTTSITFVGAGAAVPFNLKQLPTPSPSNSFQVIPSTGHVVAFACSGSTLYRYSRILTAAWPEPANCAAMTAGATSSAVLATNVVALATTPVHSPCSLLYQPPGSGSLLSRFGIVSISLELDESSESVSIYQQIHVDNTP